MSIDRARRAPLERARQEATRAAADAVPWVERLGRFGLAAKGAVYLLVGLLALQAALGPGGKTTDTTGALRTLLHQPFGSFLLGVIAVGLFGYAVWRLVQAALDPGGEESGAKRIGKRLGYAFSGAAYGLLGVSAVRLLTGERVRGPATQDWTAHWLAQPFGPWLVGAAGVFAIGMGLHCLHRAATAKFREELRLGEMSPGQQQWMVRAGRFGYAARGVVFGLAGWFLIRAARQVDGGEARGLGEVLNALAHQPYGLWLLGVVAAGLMAYGAYTLISARFRRLWT